MKRRLVAFFLSAVPCGVWAQFDVPLPPQLPACAAGLACAKMDARVEVVSSVQISVPDIDFGTVELGSENEFIRGAEASIELKTPDEISYFLAIDGGLNKGAGSNPNARYLVSRSGNAARYSIEYQVRPINEWGTHGLDAGSAGLVPFEVGPFGFAAKPQLVYGNGGTSVFPIQTTLIGSELTETGIYTDTVTVFVVLSD